MLGRGHDVVVLHREDTLLQVAGSVMAEGDGHLAVCAKRGFGIAIVAFVRGPNHHVAIACGKEGAAACIGVFGGHGAVFGIVVDFEVYLCVLHWTAIGIGHQEVDTGGVGIVVDEVDLGDVAGAEHHLLRTVVVAEDAGVHKHRTRGGGIEPSQVEHGLGLTGSEEMPFAVGPCLHPCVVVVGMCPPGCVDLAGGDAYGAEGGHGKGALLSTTAIGRADGGKGRRGAAVGGLVGDALMAPVIHLEDGVGHRHPGHSLAQVGIAGGAEGVKCLVVHAQRKHEMEKQ